MTAEFDLPEGQSSSTPSPEQASELRESALQDLAAAKELIAGGVRERGLTWTLPRRTSLDVARAEHEMGLDWEATVREIYGENYREYPKYSDPEIGKDLFRFYIDIGDIDTASNFYPQIPAPNRNPNNTRLEDLNLYVEFANALHDADRESMAVLVHARGSFSHEHIREHREIHPVDVGTTVQALSRIAVSAKRNGYDPRPILDHAVGLLHQIEKDGGHIYHGFTSDLAQAYIECGHGEQAQVLVNLSELKGTTRFYTAKDMTRSYLKVKDYSGAYMTASMSKDVNLIVETLAESVVLMVQDGTTPDDTLTFIYELLPIVEDSYYKVEALSKLARVQRIMGLEEESEQTFEEAVNVAENLEERKAGAYTQIAIQKSLGGGDSREAFDKAIEMTMLIHPIKPTEEAKHMNSDDAMDYFESFLDRGDNLEDIAIACANVGYFDLAQKALNNLVPEEFSNFMGGGTTKEDRKPEKIKILLHMAKAKMAKSKQVS